MADDNGDGGSAKRPPRPQKRPVTIDLAADRIEPAPAGTGSAPGARAAATTSPAAESAATVARAPASATAAGSSTAASPSASAGDAASSAAAAAAMPGAPAGTAGSTSPPRPAAPARPSVPPPRPTPDPEPPPPRGIDIRAVIFGVVGGLVVALVFYLLVLTGLLILPARDDATTAAALRAATERMDALAADIADVSADLAAFPSVAETTAPLADRIAAAEESLAALSGLPAEVQRVAATPPAGLSQLAADVAALRQRVDALSTDMQAVRRDFAAAAATVGDPAAGAALVADINAVSERVAALEAEAGPDPETTAQLTRFAADLAALRDNAAATSEALARAETAARALAIANLAAAAERGAAFAAEIATLRQLSAPADALGIVQPLAGGGTATRAELQAAFPAVVDAILAAVNQPPADASFWERLWGNAQTLVSVRPIEPIEGTTPTAVVSRMTAAVAAGDFAAALSERDALPSAGQAASEPWATAAAERLALDAAVASLSAAMPTAAP